MIIQHKYLLKILVFNCFQPWSAEYSLLNKKLFLRFYKYGNFILLLYKYHQSVKVIRTVSNTNNIITDRTNTDSSCATDGEEPNFKEQPQEHLRSYNGSEDGGSAERLNKICAFFVINTFLLTILFYYKSF